MHPALLAVSILAAVLPDAPTHPRLDALNAALRSGDEGAIRVVVENQFTETMRKAGPADPGILPFLLDLSRRHRGFDLVRTIDPAPTTVIAVVRSVAEPSRVFRLNLSVEPAPPHRIAGLFLLAAEPGDAPAQVADLTAADAVARFGKEVERLVASGFSGVVLLARGSEILLERSGGEADRANHVPNTPETVFGLASMNKMFTAVAIGKLVEQGKLRFDDPVGRHLKGWLPDEVASRVTVHQLLTHTSGLGDYLDRIETDAALRTARSLAPYRDAVRTAKLEGRESDGLRYSNLGYVVLGALIEAVSGRDYFDFVREEILAPAGMTRTGSFCRDEIVERRAVGYIPPDEAEAMGLGKGWRTNQRFEGTRGTSAGGGMSTAGDLFRFARAFVDGKLVKQETRAELLKPRVPFLPGSRYAYGFVVRDREGTTSFGHSGGFPGVAGELRVYGEGEWTLVVLSNVSEGSGEMLAAWDALALRIRR